MYKLIASILVILAVLLTWYLTQDDAAPTHRSDDGGIKINWINKGELNEKA